MYGWIGVYSQGGNANTYFQRALETPSPITDDFDRSYFDRLMSDVNAEKMSAKAFLATEQRIPGFGNGVLQDVLFYAKVHPKTKLCTLTDSELDGLFASVRETLTRMADDGGRDTELDIYGNACGYATIMSRNNLGNPCPACGEPIQKASYMGGSVYCCPHCQRS